MRRSNQNTTSRWVRENCNIASLAIPLILGPGLEAGELSDLIAIDCTYAEGVQQRREIIRQNPQTALQCTDAAVTAASELYEWMFGTYLPKRFPSMFSLDFDSDQSDGRQLINVTTGESIPVAAPESGRSALKSLGEHVDSDFIIMLPSSQAEDGSPIYHLQGFVNPCPAGFNLYERLGLPLSGVHGPVPGYKDKLERSMDRTFARLELGKLIRRRNWSIATNDHLFNLGGTHIFRSKRDLEREARGEPMSEQLRMEIEVHQAEVRIEDCRLRSERQSLFRLPKTGAVIFSFKTYLYTLEEIKASGQAEALADAIEGLGQGNVPEFRYYKREVVWGSKVLEYLRS
jgi:hypothetical protein